MPDLSMRCNKAYTRMSFRLGPRDQSRAGADEYVRAGLRHFKLAQANGPEFGRRWLNLFVSSYELQFPLPDEYLVHLDHETARRIVEWVRISLRALSIEVDNHCTPP